uniref:mRNA-decapping enzyme 2 n=1 Tax=Branchiostoma floridae TaxID=7739 RepID=C3Z6B1_BRAFL|eukprot:XP_002595934.1 hypothetical protein BRAFLDRAFT_98536 [Branchiostoma floridae]
MEMSTVAIPTDVLDDLCSRFIINIPSEERDDLIRVLLVQGYLAKASWGFPKGKVNKDEPEDTCAIREVLEETSFDITPLLDPEAYIEHRMNEQLVRLYIVAGVSMETDFKPKTRKEIKCLKWFRVEDLPAHKKDTTPKTNLGLSPNNFFMVMPFIKTLRKWITTRKKAGSSLPPSKHLTDTAVAKTASSTTNMNRSQKGRKQDTAPDGTPEKDGLVALTDRHRAQQQLYFAQQSQKEFEEYLNFKGQHNGRADRKRIDDLFAEMNFLRFCCCRSAIIKRQICHVIVLYILVFCLILPPICYRLPFSVYYSQKLYLWNLSPSVYARQVNDERIAKAVEFFVSESVSARLQDESLLHIGNLSSGSNTTNVRTTVAFVTTRRTRSLHPTEEYSPRYLLQTVAAVVRENQPSTRILICNMDPEPSAHTDAVYLSEFFSMVSRYGDDEVSVPHGKHEKEKQDYVYCLKKSLQTNPRYVLMLQDDALVVPGSLQVLDYVVRTKVERTRHGWDFTPNNDTRKLLKLHTPEYIQRDFHTVKPKRIAANLAELLGYGLFGGTLLRLLHIILVRKGKVDTFSGFFSQVSSAVSWRLLQFQTALVGA